MVLIIFLLIYYFCDFFLVKCEMFHTLFLEPNAPQTSTPCHLGAGGVQGCGYGSTQSSIFKEELLIIIFICSYYLLFILFSRHNKTIYTVYKEIIALKTYLHFFFFCDIFLFVRLLSNFLLFVAIPNMYI